MRGPAGSSGSTRSSATRGTSPRPGGWRPRCPSLTCLPRPTTWSPSRDCSRDFPPHEHDPTRFTAKGEGMIPAAFDYHAPGSLAEAIELLGRFGDAKVLSGGQSLLPLLKLRMGAAGHLIDINHVPGLEYIK